MSKKKPIQCSTCFYGLTGKDAHDRQRTWCRRYPKHSHMPTNHWCGEYLDEDTGKDLVQRPE